MKFNYMKLNGHKNFANVNLKRAKIIRDKLAIQRAHRDETAYFFAAPRGYLVLALRSMFNLLKFTRLTG